MWQGGGGGPQVLTSCGLSQHQLPPGDQSVSNCVHRPCLCNSSFLFFWIRRKSPVLGDPLNLAMKFCQKN